MNEILVSVIEKLYSSNYWFIWIISDFFNKTILKFSNNGKYDTNKTIEKIIIFIFEVVLEESFYYSSINFLIGLFRWNSNPS